MKVIVPGKASGIILRSSNAINFLGAINKNTGIVTDSAYDISGRKLGGSMLVFPHGIGSSVGAYTIYSLKSNGAAPAAMICKKADLTVASGCALAGIPMVVIKDGEYDLLEDGRRITLDTSTGIS